jgi:glucan phosphoethanolaminetransferase (alkaline phosphatase superfamily)
MLTTIFILLIMLTVALTFLAISLIWLEYYEQAIGVWASASLVVLVATLIMFSRTPKDVHILNANYKCVTSIEEKQYCYDTTLTLCEVSSTGRVNCWRTQ